MGEVITAPHVGTLPSETRAWLLGWARRSIYAALDEGESAPDPETVPEGAAELRGCFVTLHRKSGELRGCIGTFDETTPLWRNVRQMAVAAATRDPRFVPLGPGELAECLLEISVLTPRRKARSEEVQVGRHGLWIQRGFRSGVLLPQVAVEHGWDRETFLDYTCLKAGLARGAWREPDTRIEVFEAEVFGE